MTVTDRTRAGHTLPRLFVPNFSFEDELTGRQKKLSAAASAVVEDLSPLIGILGQPGDCVLVDAVPDADSLPACLQQIEFVATVDQLQHPHSVVPFGWSATALSIARQMGSTSAVPAETAVRAVNSRLFNAPFDVVVPADSSRQLRLPFRDREFGVWCEALDGWNQSLGRIQQSNTTGWIAKPAISHAGRNRIVGRGSELAGAQAAWLGRQWLSGGVYLEPQVPVTQEWSLHFDVGPGATAEGPPTVEFRGWTWQITGSAGQYQASVIDRASVPEAINTARRHCQTVANAAAMAGYTGPLGIDGFAFRDCQGTEGWRLCSDINARYSMGRLALQFAETVPDSPFVLWGLYKSPVSGQIWPGLQESPGPLALSGVNFSGTSPFRVGGRPVQTASVILSGSALPAILDGHNRLAGNESVSAGHDAIHNPPPEDP